MASFASSVVVCKALQEIGNLYGNPDLPWKAGNDFQDLVLSHMPDAMAIANVLKPGQLISKSAHDAGTVNQFLRNNNFETVQLEDHGSGPSMAYAASIIKLLGEWLEEGETGYQLPNLGKPAFRLPYSAGVSHYKSMGRRLVRVITSGDFDFWVSQTIFETGFEMIEEWLDIISEARPADGNGAVLPLVSIEATKVDISKLVGMTALDVVIEQAIAAAKFQLTQKRVKFEMAAAVSAKRGGCERREVQPGDFVVAGPLYFALVKRRLPLMPLAVGSIDPTEFSHYGELG